MLSYDSHVLCLVYVFCVFMVYVLFYVCSHCLLSGVSWTFEMLVEVRIKVIASPFAN